LKWVTATVEKERKQAYLVAVELKLKLFKHCTQLGRRHS
jgi:hypothetical protein